MTSGRTGTAGLEEDLELERKAVAARCPAYARALELLPGVLEGSLGRALAAAWTHRSFFAFYDRPLLLLAALRADALAEGPSHPLFPAFAAEDPQVEAVTPEALTRALAPSRERVYDALIRRSVQTNETSRAVAWLWPAALAGASHRGRPLVIVDVGASAGLNLVADALPAPWRLTGGEPLEVAREIHAVARLGLDSNPLDVSRAEDADWLRACVWPGERDRLERLEAALRAFRAARPRTDAPVLLPIEARNVPARLDLLSSTEREVLVIAYQTLVRDYLPPADRHEYLAGMEEWLATHPPGRSLWIQLEPDPDFAQVDGGCSLSAHVRAPGGDVRHLTLAHCGAHPSVLHAEPDAVAALRDLTAAPRIFGSAAPSAP